MSFNAAMRAPVYPATTFSPAHMVLDTLSPLPLTREIGVVVTGERNAALCVARVLDAVVTCIGDANERSLQSYQASAALISWSRTHVRRNARAHSIVFFRSRGASVTAHMACESRLVLNPCAGFLSSTFP
ncbi:hypothetical protein HPB50_009987 [Hyalomma asiaticum]|uniref:Uncharacterized protein n=1 Tax=Hyalomma asiaticum TaxID=266040 RepID=A0ACB7RIQ7_HYAAI|nr:hypothetical protein HPB50_009987 [Hyalomma asiaticum]